MSEAEIKKSKVSMLTVKSQSRTKSMGNFQKSLSNFQKSMSRLKVRRASYGFTGVPGIRPVERTSQLGIEFKRPALLFVNTYQLDPHPEQKFHIAKVKQATENVLDELFTGHKYNVQITLTPLYLHNKEVKHPTYINFLKESPATAVRIAGEVMRSVKAMQFNRYRVITVVTIGQKRAQSYNNAISFIWDHERDDYVDVQREVTTAFIQVTTFGIYLD